MTGDTIGRLLSLTAFNPALTLPLLLLARYTTKGAVLAREHATALKHLKTLLVLGLLGKTNAWLNDAVTNNWTNDAYVWSREVVVVTGGSDGIGKIVVRLLAEKGIKVAVLDVQELTYEGGLVPSCVERLYSLTDLLSTRVSPLLQMRSLVCVGNCFSRIGYSLYAG